MSIVSEHLSRITVGAPQAHAMLRVFPLIAARSAEARYLLLDDALKQGCARVSEDTPAAVPQLKFFND
jgi:hypothetical protein